MICKQAKREYEKMRERENIERKKRENERYFLYNIWTEFHCVSVQLYITSRVPAQCAVYIISSNIIKKVM